MDDARLSKLAEVYGQAWEAERKSIGRGIAPKGQKTKAGLRAVFAEINENGPNLGPDA